MPSVRTFSLEMPWYFYDEEFVDGIKWISNLKHLWLRCCMCVQEQCSDADAVEAKERSEQAARDSGMTVSAEHLKDHADSLKLAEVCKRLSYLRICDAAYVIIRDESTDSTTLAPSMGWRSRWKFRTSSNTSVPQFSPQQAHIRTVDMREERDETS
jgi:hypothetical protein